MLAIVAEQTGYPTELLDPELDLEADLGIDTVKQAEMFATIREAYGIERDDSLQLRDYPTLNHVVGFVNERAGGGPSEEAAPGAGAGRGRTRSRRRTRATASPRPDRRAAAAARPLRPDRRGASGGQAA